VQHWRTRSDPKKRDGTGERGRSTMEHPVNCVMYQIKSAAHMRFVTSHRHRFKWSKHVQTSFTCQYLTLHFDVVPRLMMMVVGLGACLAFSLILQSSDCNGVQSRKVNASRHQVYSSLFKSICLGHLGHETSVIFGPSEARSAVLPLKPPGMSWWTCTMSMGQPRSAMRLRGRWGGTS